MVRTLGVLISATLGALAAMLVAAAAAPRRWVEQGGVVDPSAASAALAREVAVAAQAGMQPSEHGEAAIEIGAGISSWSMPLRIAADECVAVIAVSDGRARVVQVAVQPEARARELIAHDAMSVGSNGGGLVAHTQWCERAAVTRRFVVAGEPVVPGGRDAHRHRLRWAVHRGSWQRVGGPMRLNRGRLRPESLEALGADIALREGERLVVGERLGGAVPVAFGSARLVPADAVTYAALLRASVRNDNPRVNPRIDPTPVARAPWPTGLPLNFVAVRASTGVDLSPALHDPVVDLGLNDYRRVLAVVDRARLGAPCARVALVRARYGFRPQVEAMAPDGSVRALREQDNVAFDDQCAAGEPTVYLAPWRDHDAWTLHALRPTPST